MVDEFTPIVLVSNFSYDFEICAGNSRSLFPMYDYMTKILPDMDI